MTTFFYRYADHMGLDVSGRANLTAYKDLSLVANYAQAPFAWAVHTGLVNGTSATKLSPTQSANRAQIATILMRYDTEINRN